MPPRRLTLYRLIPRVTISHIRTPNEYTSDFNVYLSLKRLSGAIQRMGNAHPNAREWLGRRGGGINPSV